MLSKNVLNDNMILFLNQLNYRLQDNDVLLFEAVPVTKSEHVMPCVCIELVILTLEHCNSYVASLMVSNFLVSR